VPVGDDTSCAVTLSGDLACWGDNSSGVMGAMSPAKFSSPTVLWSNANKAKTVTLGYYHGCLLAQDNSVYCWGLNDHLQLGTGVTATYSITPTKIVGL
jgi:alpha-tubulin suppressor-like RCC1 family protein